MRFFIVGIEKNEYDNAFEYAIYRVLIASSNKKLCVKRLYTILNSNCINKVCEATTIVLI